MFIKKFSEFSRKEEKRLTYKVATSVGVDVDEEKKEEKKDEEEEIYNHGHDNIILPLPGGGDGWMRISGNGKRRNDQGILGQLAKHDPCQQKFIYPFDERLLTVDELSNLSKRFPSYPLFQLKGKAEPKEKEKVKEGKNRRENENENENESESETKQHEKLGRRQHSVYASIMIDGGMSLYDLLTNMLSNDEGYLLGDKERYLTIGEFQYVNNQVIHLVELLTTTCQIHHGDIHTKNFVINEDGLIRLIDFDYSTPCLPLSSDKRNIKYQNQCTTYQLCRTMLVLLNYVHSDRRNKEEDKLIEDYKDYLCETGEIDVNEYIEY
jgi:hypothetical protein